MQHNAKEKDAMAKAAELRLQITQSAGDLDNPQVNRIIADMKRDLIRLLGDKDADEFINVEAVRKVWGQCFVDVVKNQMVMVRENSVTSVSRTDAREFSLLFDAGTFYTQTLREALDLACADPDSKMKPNDIRKTVKDIETKYFTQTLWMERQMKSATSNVDIFATKGSLLVSGNTVTITQPHTGFRPVDKDGHPAKRPDAALIKRVHADIMEHFPLFEDLMGQLLHARFATDRRSAFVWFHAESNFGKGLFVEVMKRLGLVCELSTKEIEKALEGAPVGVSPDEAVRAWVLYVDEWKSASRELKNINNSIMMAAKHQMRTTVPTYLKLFSSAEMVHSLVGSGIERQFLNRFAHLRPAGGGANIDHRPLFQDLGKETYINAAVWWLHDFLTEGIERFRAMGKVAASKFCDEACAAFLQKFKLSDEFGSLEDTVESIADDIVQFLNECHTLRVAMDRNEWGAGSEFTNLTGTMKTAVVNNVSFGYLKNEDGGKSLGCVINHPQEFAKQFIAMTHKEDPAARAKLSHKVDDIVKHLSKGLFNHKLQTRVYPNAESKSTEFKRRGAPVFLSDEVDPFS